MEFKIKDILENFLREYTEELFNGYEKYCNQEEIKEHLQKVINTLKKQLYIIRENE